MGHKIYLSRVLWARKTEQHPRTLVCTKSAGHKASPGWMLHCPNQNKQVAQRRYRDCRKAGSPRATSVVSTTAQQNCEENYTEKFAKFNAGP